MAATLSTGSPKLARKSSSNFVVVDQNEDGSKAAPARSASQVNMSRAGPPPLQTGNLANFQPKTSNYKAKTETNLTPKPRDPSNMDNLATRVREMQVKDSQQSSSATSTAKDRSKQVMDKLIADLKSQTGQLKKQELDSKGGSDSDVLKDEDRSSGSDPFTPATESFDVVSPADANEPANSNLDVTEMLRVKQELAAAKSVITRQEQELAESRTLKHTIDQAMGPTSEADFGNRADISEETIHHLQGAYTATARPFPARTDSWHPQEDSRSDNSDGLSAGVFNRGRGIWNGNSQPAYGANPAQPFTQQTNFLDNRNVQGAWPPATIGAIQGAIPANQRVLSGPSPPTYGFEGRFPDNGSQFNPGGMRRTTSQYNRPSAGYNVRAGPFGGGFGAGLPALNTSPVTATGYGGALGYQPPPIGTPLSATASEFTANSLPNMGNAWSQINNAPAQTYVTPLEPMNYRRLLDKAVSCDWKYIVDKIVCSNDQQASIFLQQKLKVGTAEQKFEIVDAIVQQAYALMINRFGNFLVQRCFEHGTPEQVVAIADAIHGNVLNLSMDSFGCHVVQKAFDSVPENHKADMVRELLRRIPDTVIHRYACHVWQKLFELRWSGEPPQIMLKVNEALRGMWHEVALGETGSLVVQNIFENCVEEEKRPAIEEVIASIDLISHGQFGNWCIQHLCEHGSPPDKRRVVDHILANAYSYSIDQYASKVVEKCLKIGGAEFLERYLGVVTTAHPERPRIPLIDISGDQYGNYLVQWILMNTPHHQREQVASHIRKHMVSLRGSKFGSRVAMLCCNPASVTRPGPGVIVNPFGAPGQPRGGWGRFR